MTNIVRLKYLATITSDKGDTALVHVVGRNAWFLLHLIERGERGLSTIERQGPRMSQYAMLLRRAGFNIATHWEKHDGSFAGEHGRYELLDKVSVDGGTLAEWLASAEGRREFPVSSFGKVAA